MKKCFVTGADGFIGSHLVEYLVSRHYHVTALCMYNSLGSYGWIDTLSSDVKDSLTLCLGDIRDPHFLKKVMKGSDYVFHLASLIAIPYSYVAPASYVDTNIHGTLNVMEAARDLEVEKIVHTSTSETYGTAQFVPITEEHPLVGQSPYAASKIGADQLALSFWRSFNTPITVLRPFNTYGPRQSARAVIPTIISQIASGKKNIKLGSLTPTRDFNFVTDTCAAFLDVAVSNQSIGEVFNAASNFEISIEETAMLISDVMNTSVNFVSEEERKRPELSEVNRLFGSNEKLKKLTGWQPKYGGIDGFRDGIDITVKWFRDPSNLEKYSVNAYTI